MSKPRGEGPSPHFSIAPFLVGLFMTMPVLGRPSLEESYLSLANWSGSGPSQVSKVGRGWAPAREISFVSLAAYGSKVSDSTLTMGGYSFWNQTGWLPTLNLFFVIFSLFYSYFIECYLIPLQSLNFVVIKTHFLGEYVYSIFIFILNICIAYTLNTHVYRERAHWEEHI